MMNCVIVDDEPLARERFRHQLEKIADDITIVAEADSGAKALPLIYDLQPDVVFLDIQMPGMSGFEVIDLLEKPRPHIIFVTAYDEFALRAFEAHALDYLTKPVRLERLQQSIERLRDVQGFTQEQQKKIDVLRQSRKLQPLARLTVHAGQRLKVVPLHDIARLEADEKLVFAHIPEGKFWTDFTLDELEERLQPTQFIRIHRSHIVNIDVIREIIPWFSGSYCVKLADGTQLPIARRRTQVVREAIGQKR